MYKSYTSARLTRAEVNVTTLTPTLTNKGFGRIAYFRRAQVLEPPFMVSAANASINVGQSLSGGSKHFKAVYLPATSLEMSSFADTSGTVLKNFGTDDTEFAVQD